MKTLYICTHLFTDHSRCLRNHRSCLCIQGHEEPEGRLQTWSPSNRSTNVTRASADTGKWDRGWAPPTRPASVSRAARTSDAQLRGHLNVDSLIIWKTRKDTDYLHSGGSLLTYTHTHTYIYASSQRYIIFLVDWSGNRKALGRTCVQVHSILWDEAGGCLRQTRKFHWLNSTIPSPHYHHCHLYYHSHQAQQSRPGTASHTNPSCAPCTQHTDWPPCIQRLITQSLMHQAV